MLGMTLGTASPNDTWNVPIRPWRREREEADQVPRELHVGLTTIL